MALLLTAGYLLQNYFAIALICIVAAIFLAVRLIFQLRSRLANVAAKQRHNIELEERVKQRTIELQESNRQLAEANKLLQVLSTIDPLTNLYNRRGFEENYDREWRLNARQQSPLAVLMVDIDFFKQLNDSQGHVEGDNCLKKVSRLLDGTLRRPNDIIARFGGEEFVILLSDTNPQAALSIAESLRVAVEKAAIPHPESHLGKVVTISIGVASCIPNLKVNPLEMITLADQALYQAKQTGRNRIEPSPGCFF